MTKRSLDTISNDIDKKLKELNKLPKKRDDVNLSIGAKVATDLIAGISVSIIIGVYLDKQFQTAPLLLLISLCFGIAASVRSVIITLKRKNAS